MSGSVLLEVQALSIAYGSDRAVRDVSFALPRGRSLALAGSNGQINRTGLEQQLMSTR